MSARSLRILAAIVLLGTLARGASLWTWRDQLAADPDGYSAIARLLVAGQGFSDPVTHAPTAFRPPVYPLMLALVHMTAAGPAGVAVLHLILGTLTVALTALVAVRTGLRCFWVAPLIVAVDPLLLAYAPRVMTETAAALCVASVLASLTSKNEDGLRLGHFVAAGLTLGVTVMCRPVVWVVLPLVVGRCGLHMLRNRSTRHSFLGGLGLAAVCLAAVTTPWLVRNVLVMKAPILTTTHGGYTLLLANNPVFYTEVVRRPWGTTWSAESLDTWQVQIRQQMADEGVEFTDERARDRWMYARARANIVADPGGFAAACWLRLRRFWNLAPLASSPGRFVTVLTGVFYLVLFTGVMLAIRHGAPDRRATRMCGIATAFVLAFTLVHLVYWTNTRMRAPLAAPLALLATVGFGGYRSGQLPPAETD